MKAFYYILTIAALTLAACSSSYQSTSNYDDIYYEPNDKYLNDYSYEEDEYVEVEEEEQTTMTNKYESGESYSGQNVEPQSERYRDGNGNTYINNYYDAPYDYYYSSRIRRFYRPYSGFSYYSGCYTDYRWYDPYYNGVSIYFSWGTPWYVRSPGYYSYYRYPYHSYYYHSWNSWGYDPWYSPYGYYGSYSSGYHHGYWNGFYDGYYYGSGGYYGGYNNYGYYNENSGYDPTEYYYGPRYAMSSNSGMRSGRSNIKYGKNKGESGSTSTIGTRGSVKEQSASSNENLDDAGKGLTKENQVQRGTDKRGKNVLNKDRSNDLDNNSGLKPSHRRVAESKGSIRGSNTMQENVLSGSNDKKDIQKSGNGNRNEIRRKDFIQNRTYNTERKGYNSTRPRQSGKTRGSNYEPLERDYRNSNKSIGRDNTQSRENEVDNEPQRKNTFFNSGDRNRKVNDRREYNRSNDNSRRNYSTPERNSRPSRHYSPPKRNNNSAPRRKYSAPERNNNSGGRYKSGSRSSGSRSKSYSSPNRSRSSGSSGGSRGGSINRSSSPSNSGNSGGGRRHR